MQQTDDDDFEAKPIELSQLSIQRNARHRLYPYVLAVASLACSLRVAWAYFLAFIAFVALGAYFSFVACEVASLAKK